MTLKLSRVVGVIKVHVPDVRANLQQAIGAAVHELSTVHYISDKSIDFDREYL